MLSREGRLLGDLYGVGPVLQDKRPATRWAPHLPPGQATASLRRLDSPDGKRGGADDVSGISDLTFATQEL